MIDYKLVSEKQSELIKALDDQILSYKELVCKYDELIADYERRITIAVDYIKNTM